MPSVDFLHRGESGNDVMPMDDAQALETAPLRMQPPFGDRFRTGLARFLAMIALGLTLAQDPFGFFSYTEQKTMDLFTFLAAPTVPSAWNEELTVVIIDDHYVDKYASWPMPYVEHARVLKKILGFKPRAVFIDLLFTQDKDSRGIFPLVLVLNEYRNQGIKVFMTNGETRAAAMHPQIARLVEPVSTRLERGEIPYQDYKLWRQNSETNQSPAIALIQEYCAALPADPARHGIWGEACNRLVDLRDQGDANETMLLRWGTEPAEANDQAFRCNEAVGGTIAGQIKNRFLYDGASVLQDCPRYPTLLLDNLLGGFTDAELAHYLGDKVVFYGPEIEGATVWTEPPTHKALSATYTHATAFENLLIYGDRYFVMDRQVQGFSLKFLFELAIWIALCLTVAFGSLYVKPFAPQSGNSVAFRALFDISVFVFLSTIGLVLTSLQVATLNIAPANLLGIISIVLAIAKLRGSDYFEKIEQLFQFLVGL
ncbi:MAG: CHASE2 domain-containing protein, partial [Thalassobaculaceae bacterium]|nr:CHASE2 domain-containing protein [Thalassobaculaceae bacterium]